MLHTLAIANYRSLRDVVLPLERMNLVTGANGSGKSNLYRALRLLSETAFGGGVQAIGREGGLSSVLWAGPEQFAKSVRRGEHPVQGGPRRDPVNLRLGFGGDDFSYSIEYGLPVPVPRTMFGKDPEIKREVIWHGDTWHERRALVDRKGGLVRSRDENGAWQVVEQHLPTFDSMVSRIADPERAPEAVLLRERVRSWRFYDHFRTDADAPARHARIGVRTPVMSNDGHDLAVAWRTIMEIGDADALAAAVEDAFPGAEVEVEEQADTFQLLFRQHGLLRPLSQAELSDGTLRYLLWIAALLTPRPPSLMVLNEPETSIHPDLLPALARLMRHSATETQVWVTSHATALVEALTESGDCNHIQLDKDMGETTLSNFAPLELPPWRWPPR
ncbi:MAG: AAA family ATPase [Gammaproteobacteria bacterium]|nr:AAA family ATPase [Gammaproteobacteria bacterium]